MTVWFRGGVYHLKSPWLLTAEDSPGQEYTVTYAACSKEVVTISGARQIDGWCAVDQGLWRCELADVADGKWQFRQLLVNGRRAIRARYPNLDEPHPFVHIIGLDPPAEMTSSRLKFWPDQLAAWSAPNDAEIVMLGSWDILRKRLAHVDPGSGTVDLAPPHIVNHISISPKPGLACYFENAREGAVGIWDGSTEATTIAHNEVHSLPYTGISVGFIWRDWPAVCRKNVVEFNHVYDVMNWLGDGGGIYTLGLQPETTVRGYGGGRSGRRCASLPGGYRKNARDIAVTGGPLRASFLVEPCRAVPKPRRSGPCRSHPLGIGRCGPELDYSSPQDY